MADASLHALLLASAERDALVVRKLLHDTEVHDASLGFHVQQAIEKSLKSVLAASGVIFRRTHDIAELLDLLDDHGLAPPPFGERLDELTPYAVEARYGLIDPPPLDRAAVAEWTQAVLGWARKPPGTEA